MQRNKKLPISLDTSQAMLQAQPAYGKRKLVDTPVTPTILGRLAGALTGSQNDLVSKFTKHRPTLHCQHCTNVGCISITSMRNDSDSNDEDEEMNSHYQEPSLQFACTICRKEQSLQHMHQILGITAKKIKTVAPKPSPSTSTTLPGTPASMLTLKT